MKAFGVCLWVLALLFIILSLIQGDVEPSRMIIAVIVFLCGFFLMKNS